jgi:hypothetical protein
MEEMKENVMKATEQIQRMDKVHPTFVDEYQERYTEAREAAGLENFKDDESFVKYMDLDLDLSSIFYKD